jgi:hypothetical protein
MCKTRENIEEDSSDIHGDVERVLSFHLQIERSCSLRLSNPKICTRQTYTRVGMTPIQEHETQADGHRCILFVL